MLKTEQVVNKIIEALEEEGYRPRQITANL